MFAWIRALHIRERHIAALHREREEVADRLHRLEIANRQLHEHFVLLEGAFERIQARWKGGFGGRPPKAQQPETQLDMIPQGDKNALRRHFGIVK